MIYLVLKRNVTVQPIKKLRLQLTQTKVSWFFKSLCVFKLKDVLIPLSWQVFYTLKGLEYLKEFMPYSSLNCLSFIKYDRLGCLHLTRVIEILGSIPGKVKPMTLKFVFAVLPPCKQELDQCVLVRCIVLLPCEPTCFKPGSACPSYNT